MQFDQLKRREFITLFGGAATWPLAARAQQTERMRRIGVLLAREQSDPEGQKQFAALREGLAELGWSEGQTIQIEPRWVGGDPARALDYARELVRGNPDLLVANGTPSLVAMRQATSTIPIVFVAVADPVNQGLVASLSRPGGNITGFGVEEPAMGGKWLEILKEVAPRVTRVAIIYNHDTAPYAPMFLPSMQAAAPGKRITLAVQPVRTVAEIEQVAADIGRAPEGGLIVLSDSFMSAHRPRIIALAAEHRLPAIYPLRAFVTEGGLIAYGIDRIDPFHRAAAYVDRILRGAKPAELPVQQPTKFELVINMTTAKALSLTVPPTLQAIADEVIE